MHRQDLGKAHERVEVDNVLYHRCLPSKKHPCGKFEDETSLASASSRPMLVAAALHDAVSGSDFRLLTDSHLGV